MILVTGAAGKTGRAVLDALAKTDRPARAWLRRPEQAQDVMAATTVVGDLEDSGLWREACRGIEALYLICPNMHPREFQIARMAIQAAHRGGVKRFLYHSVLHPQTEEMPHHWQKLRVEEEIFRSGLPFTILQPCAYMQNLLAYRQQIESGGIYPVPYSVRSRFALVDLAGVALAAARILTEEGHAGAIYELSGPANLSSEELAQTLADRMGRKVQAVQTPLDEWESAAAAAGIPGESIRSLSAMFRYYDRHGLVGNGKVLGWLLGRRPTSFRQFAARTFSG